MLGKWKKPNDREPCTSSRHILRLVERHWQLFKYSDRRAPGGKNVFGGILAYQSTLEWPLGGQ